MTTNELLKAFAPGRDGGEIHPYNPALSCGAGYWDRTFAPGEQPYPLDDEGQVGALVHAGAVDRRDESESEEAFDDGCETRNREFECSCGEPTCMGSCGCPVAW